MGISRIVKIHNILESENLSPSESQENTEVLIEGEGHVNIKENAADRMMVVKDSFQETHDTNPKYPNFPDNLMLGFILEDFAHASENLTSTFKSVKAQNLITNVGLQSIKQYHDFVLPIINEYVLLHDPQYYIRLDARLTNNQNFNILQQWLNKLCVPKLCKAQSLMDNFNVEVVEEEEEGEQKSDEDKPSELSMFKKVQPLNCINSFYWKLSQFGTKCPVSLFKGTCDIGMPNIIATYLDKVYFFKSKDHLALFLENPKKYIKEPNPKPIYKLIICGFAGCDIPLLSQNLCEKFYLKYVEFKSLMEMYINTKRKETLEDFKKHANNKVSDSRAFEAAKNKILKVKILSWKNHVLTMMKSKLNRDIPLMGEEEGEELVSIDWDLSDSSESIQNILNNKELCEQIIQNIDLLNEHVPYNLEELVEKECQQMVEKLAETAVLKDFDSGLSLEDVRNAICMIDDLDSFDDKLSFVNDNLPSYRGWVLVGLPIDIKLWAVLQDGKVFTNDVIFIYNANDTPFGENIGSETKGKQFKRNHSGISDVPLTLKKEETKINGLNRKQLSSVQEKYIKLESQKDDLSIEQMPSSIITETLEESIEVNTNKEKNNKHIKFRSQVEIIPNSDKLEYYEVNDRILSSWTDYKSSLISGKKNSFLEIDVVQIDDVLKDMENYVFSRHSFPIIDLHDSDGLEEDEEKSGVDSDDKTNEDLFASKDLGDTLFFCPVAFKEHKQIIKGDIKHCVQYKNKTYFLISAKNKEKFKVDPDSYVNFKKPLDSTDFGPLKVCVLTTVCGSGELFCKKLATILNIPFINFNYIFERHIVPNGILPIGVLYEDPATRLDLAFLRDKKLLKDLQVLREYFNSLVPLTDKETLLTLVDRFWTFQHPCTKGFLYYRFPHTLNEFKYLVSKMFLPDVIIELKIPEDSFDKSLHKIKANWTAHKGAIKKEIILHDQDTKLKYEESRKRIFRFVLNTVWSREITLKEGGTLNANEDILQRIQAEIEYAKGNTYLLDELMLKYMTLKEGEELELSEDDATHLYDEIESSKYGTDYSSIKKMSSPLHHTPSIKNIAIRYGLQPKDIDLNVVRKVHKIVCQIVPKPNYKMKTLNQQLNEPADVVMTTHEAELKEISKINRVAKKLKIPWISSVPSEYNAEQCEYQIKEDLRLKDPNCFETVLEVDIETAEKLLEIGYFYYSKFGRLCPVEYYHTKNTVQPYKKRLEKNEIYPLVHRKYMYFIYGEQNKGIFMRNVLKYVQFNKAVNIFICPLKLAVIGPVKSGKTYLAMKLANLYDLEVITPGLALRYVQRNLSWTLLADHIESCLSKGILVPDILVAKCIEVLTHVGKASVMGYVLDGVISNENMITELTKLNILPHLVIQLVVKRDHIFKHLKTSIVPKRMPLKYSPHFIGFKLKNSNFPIKHEALINNIRYNWYNVITIDPITIHLSLDQITTEVRNIHLALNENYAKMKNASKKPVKLKHMCVSPYEYDSRLNCLIENCCVGCLVKKKQFVSNCLDRPSSLLYKNNYFWLCQQHYEPFLNDPDQFLCNLDPKIFQEKPRKIVIKGKENCRRSLNIAENKGKSQVGT